MLKTFHDGVYESTHHFFPDLVFAIFDRVGSWTLLKHRVKRCLDLSIWWKNVELNIGISLDLLQSDLLLDMVSPVNFNLLRGLFLIWSINLEQIWHLIPLQLLTQFSLDSPSSLHWNLVHPTICVCLRLQTHLKMVYLEPFYESRV